MSDLRYALRTLRASPGLTLTATLTLGLGIGATTTIFTCADALVLHPFPLVHEPARLVWVRLRGPSGGVQDIVSYADYLDWREQARSFEGGLVATRIEPFGLRQPGQASPAERVWGQLVSANYFDVLGVPPLLGRGFAPEEASRPGGAPVVVISDALWRRRFGADPGIVGKEILLNNHSLTVIGVAPARFRGTTAGLGFVLWTPITMQPVLGAYSKLESRRERWLEVFGRLRSNVALEQARAQLRAIGLRIAAAHPEVEGRVPWATLFTEAGTQATFGSPLVVLLGMTAVVLLIVCANLANLLLGRAATRQRDLAIRVALGASRGRLVRELLRESSALALLGGLVGIVMAWWGRGLLGAAFPPSPLPLDVAPTVNARSLVLAAGLALITLLLFGVLPALQASRVAPQATLKDGGGSGRRSPLRGGFVVAEVALAVIALTSAGLFLHSWREVHHVDPGFRDPAHVLLVSTNLQLAGFGDSAAPVLVQQLVDRARALPGVRRASVASTVPLGFGGWDSWDVGVENYTPQRGEGMTFLSNRVGPDYFATMGIPIVRGRAIGLEDRAAATPVTVVSETFAHRFWPRRDAVGQHIRLASRLLTVVGVATDGKYRDLTEPPSPFLYLAFAQFPVPEVTLHLRAVGEPGALVGAVRREFASVDPGLPFLDPRTLEESMGAAVFLPRLVSTLLSGFAAVALALAAMGLYSVIAYAVTQRTREVGIRRALGSGTRDVALLFLRRGAVLTAVGLTFGIAGALAVGQLLRHQLFGVQPADPVALGGTALIIGGAALLASYLPARRAAKVDPMVALRYE